MGPANYYVQLFTVINKKNCQHLFLIFTCSTSPCRHAGVVPCFTLLSPLFISVCIANTVVGDPIIKREMVWDPIIKREMVWDPIIKRENGLISHYQDGQWFEIPLSRGRMVWDPIIKRENGLRSNYQEAEWFEIQLSRGEMVWDPIIKRENGLRSNYQEREWFEIQLSRGKWFEIPLRCLTLPHFDAYPKPESGFPVPYVMVFMCSMTWGER